MLALLAAVPIALLPATAREVPAEAVLQAEAAVLKSLMSRRYTAVLFEGRPVPVKYNFAITLKAAE